MRVVVHIAANYVRTYARVFFTFDSAVRGGEITGEVLMCCVKVTRGCDDFEVEGRID